MATAAAPFSMDELLKKCGKCGESKPRHDFNKDRTKRDGLQSICRVCSQACYKAWNAANRARKAEASRAWYKANWDRKAETDRAWRKAHPDKVRAMGQKRRALKAGVPSEPVSYDDLRQRDGDDCGICGTAIDFDLEYPDPMSRSRDHVLPLSHGGHDTADNLRLAHLRCNVSRGNRLTDEELTELTQTEDDDSATGA